MRARRAASAVAALGAAVICAASPVLLVPPPADAREPDIACRIPIPFDLAAPGTEGLPALAPQPHPEHEFGTGAGVAVAVIDTGVADHPDLGGVEPVADLVDPEAPNPLLDCDGHGTIVAGIIAARGGPLLGVAPGARILSIRQSSAHYRTQPPADATAAGDPAGTLASLATAIDLAVERGARVINASVVACVPADAGFDPSLLDAALRHAEAAGTVVVAAAGNASAQCPADAVVYPAAAPTVLAVGARSDAYALSDYSIPATDRFVSAAGFTPVGLSPSGAGLAAGMATDMAPGSQETHGFEGTSFAAPVVSGMAALLIERHPQATPAQIRDLLYATSHPPLGALEPGMLAGPAAPLTDAGGTLEPVAEVVAPAPWWEQGPHRRALGLAGGLAAACLALVIGAGIRARARAHARLSPRR